MLHGALQEFSLPDVFQLLTLTAKSGALQVEAAGQQGEVRFRHGAVTFATSDSRRLPLAALLVADGMLGEEQLQAALAAHRSGGAAALLRALRDGGVDSDTLETALREQVRDAVSTLMRREQGSFAFTPEPPGEDDQITVDAGELVDEARRRIDEWAAMCDSLPSMDAIVAFRPALPADTGAVEVTAAEWQLLAFVDGIRRVRDIVELTAKGEHASCQLLDGLVRKGLLEAVDADAGQTGALGAVLARRAQLLQLEHNQLGGAAPEQPAPAVEVGSAPEQPAPAVEVGSAADLAVELHPYEAGQAAAPPDSPEEDDARSVHQEPAPAEQDSAPAAALGEAAAVKAVSGAPAEGRQQAAPVGVEHPVAGAEVPRHRPLTRDEDVNKGLLLRLIDGVKGA